MSKVYEIVTNQVCEMLKKGMVPWRKPWREGSLQIFNITGRRYRGINTFLLGCLPYETPVFLTFNQIQKMGGKIIKGESSYPVYYFNWIEREDDNGNKVKTPIFRFTKAWNIEQTEGVTIPKKLAEKLNAKRNPAVTPKEHCEAIVAAMPNAPIMLRRDTYRACYMPYIDSVEVPKMDQFDNVDEFYSTLFHELGHSTGHKSRLNRKEVNDAIIFGSHNYSVEELVAEFTSAFLCAECGISNTLENSAAYIAHWFSALKKEPKMLVTAAARAQKAADYILNRQPENVEDSED